MAEVKVLTGDRVTLRAPRLADAEELFASVASDPEVTRYMSWTPHPDVDEMRRVITELFNVGERADLADRAARQRRDRRVVMISVAIWTARLPG